ncbi:hypothetical protein [Arthrobacter sp. UM1]|uniref:hypothetical protein n=1 Tax=Arthrobacter sp. UM1 TaxID=2766776 RepID=UPI001CF610F0|nr:hypothetical protein [Arthrobacter sp. UM1]MCB4207998.1 hypothetical protein [Arthrobacter sp. UM1]
MHLDPPLRPPFKQAVKAAVMGRLRAANHLSRRPVTGEAPFDLCLTSYGARLSAVPYAVESIAAGRVRPRRLILWISDDGFAPESSPMLRRLMDRGLEVLRTRDIGPHKKWHPYASGEAGGGIRPLVVADDDILYDRSWLAMLADEYARTPDGLFGLRGHFIGTDAAQSLLPYRSWRPAAPQDGLSHRVFLTSGAGTVLTPELQEAMLSQGEAFLEHAPKADDIWLNVSAVRAGLRRRVLDSEAIRCVTFPRTQGVALHRSNVSDGGNDRQLAASLDPELIERIAEEPA